MSSTGVLVFVVHDVTESEYKILEPRIKQELIDYSNCLVELQLTETAQVMSLRIWFYALFKKLSKKVLKALWLMLIRF